MVASGRSGVDRCEGRRGGGERVAAASDHVMGRGSVISLDSTNNIMLSLDWSCIAEHLRVCASLCTVYTGLHRNLRL